MKDININLFKLPLTLRLFIFTLIAIVVFYLLYLWDIANLITELLNTKQKEQEIHEQFSLVLNRQNIEKKETAQFAKIETTLNQWQKKILIYSELPSLINEILKLGASNRIYLKLFTPGQEIKLGALNKIPITIIAAAEYNDLANYLSQIANLPFIVVIGNFSLIKEEKPGETPNNTSNENLLTAEITLEAYYLANTYEKK